MNTRYLVGATVAALLAFSCTGFAADIVSEEPPAPEASIPLFSWTGAYIGLNGGYAWTNAELSAGGPSVNEGFDGGLIGVRAGYNWQMENNFVGGIEVDIDHLWNENSYMIGNFAANAGMDWQGSARIRIGYALDRTLLFATGGVAIANAYVEFPGVGIHESETFTGWTVGAGIEHAFTDNWIGSLEYRYVDYGSKDFGTPVDMDLTQHAVRVGIAYKF